MQEPTTALWAELAQIFDREGRACAARTAEALRACGGLVASPLLDDPDDRAIRSLLGSSSLPVARAMLDAHDLLPWGENPVARQIADKKHEVYATANLMGPDAPLYVPDLRVGFYYQRPNSRYALHSHAAVETYVIVAGAALWTAGEAQRDVAEGSYIHHSSYLPHACQTGPEGVVALWRWSGDIAVDSYRIHDGMGAFVA